MHLDDQVLFVHCPRTSGTAIRRSLLLGADPNARAQWPPDLGKHAFASQLRERIPAEVWETRFKFAVVRNPWDRLVSLYHLFRRPTEPTFQERAAGAKLPIKLGKFMAALPKAPKAEKAKQRLYAQRALKLSFLDWLKFCDDTGWQACPYLGVGPMTRIPQSRWFDGLDRVLRFEYREEIDGFLRARGYPPAVPENVTLHRPWIAYYDAPAYDRVAAIFAEDIARFGY